MSLIHGGDKSRYSEELAPSVRFQLPSELKSYQYLNWLTSLFCEFVFLLSSSEVNKFNAERGDFFRTFNDEGGVGGIYMGKEYFGHCKLFAYDGESQLPMLDWKGIWMRNHLDERSRVEQLYQLAEKFEEFLLARSIPYQRFGRKVGASGEHEQVMIIRRA